MRAMRGVSLSYVLNENYWRRGLMSEVLRELYAVLFEKGKLEYINSGYFAFNTASAALQQKLGMKPWLEHIVERDGEQIPTKEMLLWRADWEAEQQAAKR
jgi:RimJ/RimL family protein N-acetyltransferase